MQALHNLGRLFWSLIVFALTWILGASSEDSTALVQMRVETHSSASDARHWPDRKKTWMKTQQPNLSSVFASAKRQVMVNYGNTEYITYMNIGHQTIAGIVDTGSFELMVFSKSCKRCGRAARYDSAQSSTHRLGLLVASQSYGSGDTQSSQASDIVSVGPFKEKNQTFWEVDRANMPILQNAEFQAIIGVGPPETPSADAWEEVRTQLRSIGVMFNNSQNPDSELIQDAKDSFMAAMELSKTGTMLKTFGVGTFSVCLGEESGSDGYIVWNDTAPFDLPDRFSRVSVLGEHTWSVKLSNVRWQNSTFTDNSQPKQRHRRSARNDDAIDCHDGKGCSALLDSGTSLLVVPSAVVNMIQDTIQSFEANCSNLHLLPDLVFELDGHQFSLPPDAYVAEVTDEVPEYLQNTVRIRNMTVGNHSQFAQCRVLLMESNEESHAGPVWILGMPFFRKYYTSFHVGDRRVDRSIHIAQAAHDCTPAPPEHAKLPRRKPRARRISSSRLHVPPTVRRSRNL